MNKKMNIYVVQYNGGSWSNDWRNPMPCGIYEDIDIAKTKVLEYMKEELNSVDSDVIDTLSESTSYSEVEDLWMEALETEQFTFFKLKINEDIKINYDFDKSDGTLFEILDNE